MLLINHGVQTGAETILKSLSLSDERLFAYPASWYSLLAVGGIGKDLWNSTLQDRGGRSTAAAAVHVGKLVAKGYRVF